MTNHVHQGFILGLMLFNIFINEVESGIECTFNKFADDSKLTGAADTVGERNAVQRTFTSLRNDNLMRFSVAKYKVFSFSSKSSK